MGLGIPPTTLALLCLGGLSMMLVNLVLLIDWVRNWRHVKAYWAYGLGTGLAVLAFGILQVFLGVLAAAPAWSQPLPLGWEGGISLDLGPATLLLTGLLLIALGLLVIIIGISRVAGITMLGVHYAAELGHPSFPLFQRLFKGPQPAADKALSWAGTLEPVPAPSEVALAAPPAAAPRSLSDYALSTLGVTVVGVVYSVVLFWLTSPRTSDILSGLPSYGPRNAPASALQTVVIVLGAALSEELVYRLGIQGFFARYLGGQGWRYGVAIGLSALLWTLQHVGAMEPGWVKLAQVFPLGLMLGWLYRRHGVESCMIAHGLFNLALLPLSALLIQG